MESKWRLNVAEMGWSEGPFELIARLLGDYDPPRYVVKNTGTIPPGVVVRFFDFESGQMSWTNLSGQMAGSFPYGLPVEPD